MSTVLAPFGFRPVKPANGDIPGRLTVRKAGIASAYATAIAKGDPIKFATDGTIQRAAAGDAIDGIFEKVDYTPTGAGEMRRTSSHWVASQAASDIIAWFHLATLETVYAVQANGTLAQTSIGANADLSAGTTNPSSGWSRSSLDAATLTAAGASAQFKIFDLYESPDNAWGDAYPIVLVRINEFALGAAAGNAI